MQRLNERLSEGDRERKDLEVRLETAVNELTTTVQLSELALAGRATVVEEDRVKEEKQRAEDEARRMHQLVGYVFCWWLGVGCVWQAVC